MSPVMTLCILSLQSYEPQNSIQKLFLLSSPYEPEKSIYEEGTSSNIKWLPILKLPPLEICPARCSSRNHVKFIRILVSGYKVRRGYCSHSIIVPHHRLFESFDFNFGTELSVTTCTQPLNYVTPKTGCWGDLGAAWYNLHDTMSGFNAAHTCVFLVPADLCFSSIEWHMRWKPH